MTRKGENKTNSASNYSTHNDSRHTTNIFFDDDTSDDDDETFIHYVDAGGHADTENDDNNEDDDVIHGVRWSIPLPPSRQRRSSATSSASVSESRRSMPGSSQGGTDAATPLLQHRRTPQTSTITNTSTNRDGRRRPSSQSQPQHQVQPDRNNNNNYNNCMKPQANHNFNRILFGDTGSSFFTGNRRRNQVQNQNHEDREVKTAVTTNTVATSSASVVCVNGNNMNSEIELQGRRRRRRRTKNRTRRRNTTFCRPDKTNKDSLAGYFFGFMFEDDDDDDGDNDEDDDAKEGLDSDTTIRSHLEVDGSGIFSSPTIDDDNDDDDYDDYDHKYYDDDDDDDGDTTWNVLNMALFVSYFLTSATTTLPVLVVPKIGQELLDESQETADGPSNYEAFENYNNAYADAGGGDSGNGNGNGIVDISAFISRCASSAVLGVAIGKLLNAPLPDVIGARRTSSICAALLSVPLALLALSSSATSVTLACFLVEFIQSVQWPCVIVLLSVHYNLPHQRMQYQNGIYLTSIASKLGSIVAVPLFSSLLGQFHWRICCLVGAWFAIISSSIMYLYIMDSPTEINQPQNALQPHLAQQLSAANPFKGPQQSVIIVGRVVKSIFTNNLLPSVRHVLTSWTFWVVALSHTGSSLVLSSQRILGTYYYDTSLGYLPDAQSAGSLVVFLPLGTIFGLAIAGNLFAHRKGKNRKRLVTQLYIVSIVSCYVLSILSIPRLRHAVDSPDLILFAQIVASLAMGFGIAVMSSVIPGLASAAFGNHRGFYTAYTDGVAYGISSMVWRVVAKSVEYGNPEGGGWAYGWAAVALLVVLSAILLIECWSVLPAINGRSSSLSTTSTIRV